MMRPQKSREGAPLPAVAGGRSPHSLVSGLFALASDKDIDDWQRTVCHLLRSEKTLLTVNLLYPKFSPGLLPAMIGAASCGAAVAGLYGIVHDQITYTISAEYFTRLKFEQFAYADFGLAPRGFVAVIGFLATWWVGFFSGWFLARVLLPSVSGSVAVAAFVRCFAWIIVCALAAGLTGGLMASAGIYDHPGWEVAAHFLAVTDVPAFVKVAFIHNGGYLGGLIGLILAILHCKRLARAGRIGSRPSSRPL